MEKVLALISGGIDSPVAAYMIGSLGYEIIPVYFDNEPFSGETTKNRMLAVVRSLKKHFDYIDNVLNVPNGQNLTEFAKECHRKYTCILCRKMMFRIAEKIASKVDAKALVTGEFLGSKASQTLQNLIVVTKTVKIPILRPLLGMDKLEIEKIGKEIGTYNSSIIPASCCSITPEKPSTEAKLNRILEEENKVKIHEMARESVEGIEYIKVI